MVEGMHRWFNTLQIKNGNFKNIFKCINVLRVIYKEEDVNIDAALNAGEKKHRKRVADFEKRDEKIIACLEVYAKLKTYETKLRQLHNLASKLTLDVLNDITDENAHLPIDD